MLGVDWHCPSGLSNSFGNRDLHFLPGVIEDVCVTAVFRILFWPAPAVKVPQCFFVRSRQTWRFPSKLLYSRYIWAEDLQPRDGVVPTCLTYLSSSCGAEGWEVRLKFKASAAGRSQVPVGSSKFPQFTF